MSRILDEDEQVVVHVKLSGKEEELQKFSFPIDLTRKQVLENTQLAIEDGMGSILWVYVPLWQFDKETKNDD